LFRWIHQRGAQDFDQMSDLAKSLRDKLKGCAQVLPCRWSVSTNRQMAPSNGFLMWAGNAVEAVFIPEDDRGTLCVSSQAGCAVGCRFCSTGHQGFSRNLTTGEIVSQLWFAEHVLRKRFQTQDRVISNVVMMGMGAAAELFGLGSRVACHAGRPWLRSVASSRDGLDVRRGPHDGSARCGLSGGLGSVLHAPNDALRDVLVPLNRKYPIDELLDACNRYLVHAPRDFITFEYCMLDGVNDQPEHAHQLVELVRKHAGKGVWCKFNLIPFNPFPASGLRRSESAQVSAFAHTQRGRDCHHGTQNAGDDIDAACGQLAGEVQDAPALRNAWPSVAPYPLP
jgi:23S rRNA (adenine2503-C2)-methyltransferase